MDQCCSDLRQNDLEDNFERWASAMDLHYADDEFAPGAPPLQNGWEKGAVENGGQRGDLEGRAVVGAKRTLPECSGEAEEAKKRRVNENAGQNAAFSVRQFRAVKRSISIPEDEIEELWLVEANSLCGLMRAWIFDLQGARGLLIPRSAHARFPGLSRLLIEAAGINMRRDAPFRAMRANAPDNKLKEFLDDGAISTERACLSASNCKLLCDCARWKADDKRHLRRLWLAAFRLIGSCGREALRRTRSADFKKKYVNGAVRCERAEAFGKGDNVETGAMKSNAQLLLPSLYVFRASPAVVSNRCKPYKPPGFIL